MVMHMWGAAYFGKASHTSWQQERLPANPITGPGVSVLLLLATKYIVFGRTSRTKAARSLAGSLRTATTLGHCHSHDKAQPSSLQEGCPAARAASINSEEG